MNFKDTVDIILEIENKIIPIEIKYKNNLKKSDFLSLKNFIACYPDHVPGYLINLGDNKTDNNNIKLVSPFDFWNAISK